MRILFRLLGVLSVVFLVTACVGIEGGGAPPPGSVDPQACGGLSGLSCGDGQYCDLGGTPHCGAADNTGICRDIPQACTREYMPVCGCDGKTYSNACTAAANGASVASQGACQ